MYKKDVNEIRVLKFGGSSVATAALIHNVAAIVEEHYLACKKVVVVVSAMGKSTDQLQALASEVSPHAKSKHRRELDMMLSVGERISMSLLSMAIRDRGIEALSLTGSQSGIITTETHGEAEILEIKGERILKALAESKVVIVAGFQGISTTKEITTLGRGGSDTTAIALALFLKCSPVRIYSDVDAYYSADPKLVPAAHRYEELPWEIGALSSFYGAKVLHHKAAQNAAESQLEVQLLSTFNPHGKCGLLRGGVTNKGQSFQVFTLNMKKGLQKLTTKNPDGLAKKYPSELKSEISKEVIAFNENNTSEVFDYFGDNFAGHQEPLEKNFQEYWVLSLVGTALHTKSTLLDDSRALLSSHAVELEAHSWTHSTLCLIIKANPELEKPLLQSFHDHFIK